MEVCGYILVIYLVLDLHYGTIFQLMQSVALVSQLSFLFAL